MDGDGDDPFRNWGLPFVTFSGALAVKLQVGDGGQLGDVGSFGILCGDYELVYWILFSNPYEF